MREAAKALTLVGPVVDLSEDERTFLGPIDPQAMMAELHRPETSHEQRLLIGERLDVLGDPRAGIGLVEGVPDIDWRRIEGRDVTIEIRADPSDPDSNVSDTLTRTVAPFLMVRYPITVAQFQAFVDDCEGRWRLPEGFPLVLPDSYARPRRRSRYANHPAAMVKLVRCDRLLPLAERAPEPSDQAADRVRVAARGQRRSG